MKTKEIIEIPAAIVAILTLFLLLLSKDPIMVVKVMRFMTISAIIITCSYCLCTLYEAKNTTRSSQDDEKDDVNMWQFYSQDYDNLKTLEENEQEDKK